MQAKLCDDYTKCVRINVMLVQAVKRLLRNASSRDVTLFEVEGGYHELFMGPEKDIVMQRMIQWLLQHADFASAAAKNANNDP